MIAAYRTTKSGKASSYAMLSANDVFPFPGGPTRSSRWRGSSPCARSTSARNCSSTSSRHAALFDLSRNRSSIGRSGSRRCIPPPPSRRRAAVTCERPLKLVFGVVVSTRAMRSATPTCLFARSSAAIASAVMRTDAWSPDTPALTKSIIRSLRATKFLPFKFVLLRVNHKRIGGKVT